MKKFFFLVVLMTSLAGIGNELKAQVTTMYAWVWSGDTNSGMKISPQAQKKLAAAKKAKKPTPVLTSEDFLYDCNKIIRHNNDCPAYSYYNGAKSKFMPWSSVCNRPPKGQIFL